MSTFRTKHFVDMAYMLKTYSATPDIDLIQLNQFVDYMVFNFATDNRLFNERLFRNGCGAKINQDCIIVKIETIQETLRESLTHAK